MSEPLGLVLFDVDGTLTQSVAVDEACFVRAFADVLGIQGINTDWLTYTYQTDSGLTLEICRRRLGRDPNDTDTGRLRARFVELLRAAVGDGTPHLQEVPGAGAFLRHLQGHSRWGVALATGGWGASARFKLASAGLPVDVFPWATADDALDRVDILRAAVGRAARAYGQDPFARLVYVGDGVWDVRAAKALGVGFLGVATGAHARRLREEGARWVVPDFSDWVRATDCLNAAALNPLRARPT